MFLTGYSTNPEKYPELNEMYDFQLREELVIVL